MPKFIVTIREIKETMVAIEAADEQEATRMIDAEMAEDGCLGDYYETSVRKVSE